MLAFKEDFFLELGKLDQDNIHFLAESFDHLPPNPYLDGGFRLRRYSHFRYTNGHLSRLPTKTFVQSSEINRFQGDVERQYEEIEDNIVQSIAFNEMFDKFKAMAHVDDEADIEVHQIRIIASPGKPTPVAPEGVHQDGFDRIGIFVIDREHISGGELQIYENRDSAPIMQYAFDHGEFVVLNDRRFYHGAAEITATEEGDAHMDVFVLTANVNRLVEVNS
ncbi:2OG-Fe dioxygenase family protein [Catenovulum sp. SM1970]|uniref:2OG-Fe dioxygenase family protein n=1 Tax=Marinifaba aquimaris TaxID=2741323 RepID=UPI001573B33A|nr:2OG-Fe dioxygenase family protein [Marinifaba aquimaris]NTS76600.1 2OG-Fe dioxygenase family protein [Marinifaba aquimaris]